MMSGKVISVLLLLLPLAGCRPTFSGGECVKLTHLNIIDRNGMSETISSPDRLTPFQKTNFLSPQPYEKVLRVFERNRKGEIYSCITSYHPNGLVKQYLEAVNNRACGLYREWHPNGQLKVESFIVGGIADINTAAEESWLFDGLCKAWDEEGNSIALIAYEKGALEGESLYYHTNGATWKRVPYRSGRIEGKMEIYVENGALFQLSEYKEGKREGKSIRYWPDSSIAYEEEYHNDQLLTGRYFHADKTVASEIVEGNGFRAVFGKETLQELRQYTNGKEEGEVKIFGKNGALLTLYRVKDQEKEGEEIHYFESNPTQPKILMTWRRGILHGVVKSWYENGTPQAQTELSQNKRMGLSTAWYKGGELMLAEEYDNDLLIKGEYYKKGEKQPLSSIEYGKGFAALFDEEGNFLRKVAYVNGKPDLPSEA